jgi:transcriptional regulator with XRE-family HTH domain
VQSITRFGELLKYLRRRAGLTQYALGIAVGYSESQIARLESGQRFPDVLAVKTHFVSALGLQFDPALSKRLVNLAIAARTAPSTAEAIAGSGLIAKHNLPLSLTRLIWKPAVNLTPLTSDTAPIC